MRHRKDDNQPAIEQALRKAGAVVIDCTVAPSLGFDMLVAIRGRLFVVEVKDGSKDPSRRKLTDGELKRQAEIELKGIRYNVVESEEDALRLIGAVR